MRIQQNKLHLSATDLANHLSCPHLTNLSLSAAREEIVAPEWQAPHLVVLRQRGMDHERGYIQSLMEQGLEVVDYGSEAEDRAFARTVAAMEAGVTVIYQGYLRDGKWGGRPDVLLRVEKVSDFGTWSYEVVDCKLASVTKAETILQMSLYGELLAGQQGVEPEFFHVIRPGADFLPESYRTAAYSAYYRSVKRTMEAAVQERGATYPEPVSHCEMCRWWKRCDTERRRDDHLSLVAGATQLHRNELERHAVGNLAELAQLPLPIPFRPARGATESYTRIREQARVQLEARQRGEPRFELLHLEPGKGLARLPEPTPEDIFLDFEGDPFVEGGGREYLFGIVTGNEYQGRWALDRSHEHSAFEWLMDLIFERLERFPGLHIYHFGGYETGAVKRLMLRYATREEQLDQLLRGEVFVDLHSLTKQAVRASVEQYSLKDLEQFFGFRRRIPLREASHARHQIEHQLELGGPPEISDAMMQSVERYNEDDCRATEQLRNWLEHLREEALGEGESIPRPVEPERAAKKEASEQHERSAALFRALTEGLPEEPEARSPEQAARWLLAHALDWHRREAKVQWWEFFRLRDLPEPELFDEKSALAGLVFQQRMPKLTPRQKVSIDQYAFPAQECSVKVGDSLYTTDAEPFGKMVTLDLNGRTVDIKKTGKTENLHPQAIFAHKVISTKEQAASLQRLAEWIIANGIDTPGPYRAARDLLLRNPPRLLTGQPWARMPAEAVLPYVCRIGLALDSATLPVQGPPGSGKTYLGSHMIRELVRQGKRVGITAVSHKVIRHLLDGVLEIGEARVRCGQKVDEDDEAEGAVRIVASNDEGRALLETEEVNVLGGTPWMWARPEFFEAVDVLVVDEAGQMSLANVFACAPAGKNLVLLGDPQQLEQPQKGSHPEGSDVSALAHLLQGVPILDAAQGIFLEETWRMHPAICQFTSETFYAGQLKSRSELSQQVVEAPVPFSGAGMWFVPVTHEGNQSYSVEEIEQVAEIVRILTRGSWIDPRGDVRPITQNDVLVVAPYNDQVNRLQARLPGARVGTVDKFQGQEAAVVIYSLTTSSPEDAPRGMEFLYNLSRLNVATSRSRCACIVVASPKLLAPDCRTPRQMELANALCRYVELSRVTPMVKPVTARSA